MKIRTFLLALSIWLFGSSTVLAQAVDYSNDATYKELYNAMHHAFNDGDSAKFFPAVKALQQYLFDKKDLHGYYTQRCNEIVFEMNQQRIYEAYKMARELSKELREKKVDKEMYMAMNMLGHINRYCGNKEEAKENWHEVLRLMQEHGYYSSMPSIYLNIVNVALDDSPEEADSLLEIAKQISLKHCPERVFDIESRRTLSYYYRGDYDRFLKGYEEYKKGVAEGKSSVNGRSIEVYHEALLGHTDEAIKLAREELGDEGLDAITIIYEKAGRWEEAFHALKEQTAASDSIDNVVLTNSMMGIRDEMMIYEAERDVARSRFYMMSAVIILLALLTIALFYITQTRRRHLKELRKAYDQALESDKMKTAFIQNISHEVRTPLNIIGGFSQVIANPDIDPGIEERREIARMTQKNARLITTLIDEMLLVSLNESTEGAKKENLVEVNDLMRDLLQENQPNVSSKTTIQYDTTLADDFTILTNEYMLKIIVNALVDNAAKNTPKGTIVLRATKPSNDELDLIVEDTGCGIPAAEAEHIFERFVKLDTFKQGIGLGLPLCRMLIEKLGGTVRLDTTYTQGARFVVTLPII
jgi:signal transduction histidine kinase